MGDVVTLQAKLEECHCTRCRALARRFPNDPPQLLLPMRWPADLRLVKARMAERKSA